jgi:hypothetical protein
MGFIRIMQKKAAGIFSMVLMAMLGIPCLWASSVGPWRGDEYFEQKDYVSAIQQYELQYNAGSFSEQMLYRMAFIHENMDHPAEAAYYLKKAQLEYGGKDLDQRIRKLMRLAGTERFYTQDEWLAWNAFHRKWGLLLNLLMVAAVVTVAMALLGPKVFKLRLNRYVTGTGVILLFVTLSLNGYHLFTSGPRAVVIKPTSFYTAPGFAASSNRTIIGMGETVKVLGHEDIWVRVDAGGGDWWVPGWAIRAL